MTTLYIIGNGFDLWHGLNTRYSDFYEYAKETLDEIEAYYAVDPSINHPWHDFENCLGTYDWETLYDDYNEIDMSLESFSPSEVFGLEDEIKEQTDLHVNRIKGLFRDWICEVDVTLAKTKIMFDPDSLFITFNYTPTLTRVYGIDEQKVLHIHGSAENDDELIFGHGESGYETPDVDVNGDSNRTMFTDSENAAKYPFYAFKKPVDDILHKYKNYFSTLNCVTKIVVIGHSLNNIDLPYFKELAKNSTGCRWQVFCYTPAEFQHNRNQLISCGVSDLNIETCGYS